MTWKLGHDWVSEATTAERAKLLARLIAGVEYDPNGGCWLWPNIDSRGYGMLCLRRGKKVRLFVSAHRLSFSLLRGPIPDGMMVLHGCDVPPCCNPNHLSIGTHDDNMADKAARGRARRGGGPCGEAHYRAKLTAADVLAIRASHEPHDVLAAHFGVRTNHIRKILARGSWAHLAPSPQ